MSLPSLDPWHNGKHGKPRLQILEIRHRDKPTEEPIAILLVERQEESRSDAEDGLIYNASIRLHFTRILPKDEGRHGGHGSFAGSYSRGFSSTPSVSLTSSSSGSGGVFLDLPGLEGQRIGTYLMNEIVAWVQQWPNARVDGIQLLPGQAETEENKIRRNWFYEQFGLVFDYADPEHREGRSRSMLVSELKQVNRWQENIRERSLIKYLGETLYAEKNARIELGYSKRAVNELIADKKKVQAHPVRWALMQLWLRYRTPTAVLATLASMAAIAWLRH